MRSRTFFGIPSALIANCAGVTTPTPTCQFPTNQVVMNQPNDGKYKTVEVSITKRQSHNYSVNAGFGYTWQHDFPRGFPNTPNAPGDYDFTVVQLQGERLVQRAVGHQHQPGVPLPGGRELRASADAVGAGVVRLHLQRGERRPGERSERREPARTTSRTSRRTTPSARTTSPSSTSASRRR